MILTEKDIVVVCMADIEMASAFTHQRTAPAGATESGVEVAIDRKAMKLVQACITAYEEKLRGGVELPEPFAHAAYEEHPSYEGVGDIVYYHPNAKPANCIDLFTRNQVNKLLAARALKAERVALPMDTAPTDGTVVRLLVDFEANSLEDTDKPVWTVGACYVSDSEGDVWQFAGWDWSHDCFTEGHGKPLGWLPMLSSPPQPAAQPAWPGDPSTQDYASTQPAPSPMNLPKILDLLADHQLAVARQPVTAPLVTVDYSHIKHRY